ncbi:MAG: putative Mariner Mos1 transposase [Streblomastix strix]|uniref:Putative Mariner Mos1 transposase n=1 Tax=Streblomastix strix TaxID=222440 RepID=A0A5J4TL06_9EUKA|nr:MAG: putative Mariner Mos1 transposase [Streblomastix strix]
MIIVLSRIDYLRNRAVVEDKLLRHFTNDEIFDDLRGLYGTIFPEKVTIVKWRQEFVTNHSLVAFTEPPGRPKITGLSPQIEKDIIWDPYVSLRFLAEKYKHDKQTISRIIVDETERVKVTERWVPHVLSQNNKVQQVELCKYLIPLLKNFAKNNFLDIVTGDETWVYLKNFAQVIWQKSSLDQPERPRQAIGDEKLMFTVFFSGAKIEHIHKLPKKKTMDSVVFVDEVLVPLQQKIINNRHLAKGQIHLHFDNCRVHTSYHTSGFISNSIFTKVRHPAYSPDISPCYFFFFGILKSELKGKKFTNDAEAEAEVIRILMEIHPTEIQRAFRSWIRRCDYIIKHD